MPCYSEPYRDGWLAHQRKQREPGEPFGDNPYDVNRQAFSYAEWNRGFYARFSARKHDLPFDRVLEDDE